MQFHHHGYVSGDPRVSPAAGTGLDRPAELPDEVDVLIVGTGPAGMTLAAQLSQFPDVTTRIIERRDGRLVIGQADGIQARSVETFQAFGFAGRIIDEAYRICGMNFWSPDPADRDKIIRTERTVDDPTGISEFLHLIVNQARVLDYFAEFMANSPSRMTPDYGLEFVGLSTMADHLARNLPYGDQRRLEIARAMATDPKLILLDEPTAGMNPQETRQAEELILRIRDSGLAVVVIEHDMRFIFNLCDRVLCLVRGRALIEGTPQQVQSDPRVIEAYIGTGPTDADATADGLTPAQQRAESVALSEGEPDLPAPRGGVKGA